MNGNDFGGDGNASHVLNIQSLISLPAAAIIQFRSSAALFELLRPSFYLLRLEIDTCCALLNMLLRRKIIDMKCDFDVFIYD